MATRDFPPRPQGAEADSVPFQNWLDALGNRQNIDLQQELTSVASGDELLIFDVSETGPVKTKKATVSNIGTTIAAAGLAGTFSSVTSTGLIDISGASAGQIKFPATQNSSSNANTLDDYQEFSFTPTDTSGAGLSFSSTSGNGTKIGRQAIQVCSFTYPATADGSSAQVGGFPYSGVNASSNNFGVVTYSNSATALRFAPNTGATVGQFYTAAGAVITNATMSGSVNQVEAGMFTA